MYPRRSHCLQALIFIACFICVANCASAGRGRRLQQGPTNTTRVKVVNAAVFRSLWLENNKTRNITFIDVRLKGLYAVSHVPGARNVPADKVKQVAKQYANKKRGVDPRKDIACYCTVTQTAVTACNEFAKVKAYANVTIYALEGGLSQWVIAGYPIESGL